MTSIGPPNRRELLRLGLGGVGLSLLGDSAPADGGTELDRALERLHETVTNDEPFLSNHVPMGVEALATLGRSDAIASFLAAHLEPTRSDAASSRPVTEDRWRDALGRSERFLDWRAYFLRKLDERDWTLVLREWAARLVDGLSASATHGVIRTAHAARSLSRRDGEIRRVELGTALAYWASRYEELPWDGTLAPAASADAALASVPTRLPRQRPPRGNIVTGLHAARDTPAFHSVAGRIDTSDPERTLSRITSAFARVFLRNPDRRIHFTHAITAPSAVRLIAPYLDDETAERATRRAWQAAAALYLVYHDPRRPEPDDGPVPQREAVIARAVTNGDVHAIKLAEACLREHALAPDPWLLRAAADGAAGL